MTIVEMGCPRAPHLYFCCILENDNYVWMSVFQLVDGHILLIQTMNN